MGSNILGKHVSFERKEWLAHALALAAKIKRKPLPARAPDPTPNKGDADSLTIVAHDTGPRPHQQANPARAAQNFPLIFTIVPMKFQLLHRAVKGTLVVSLNTVTCAVHIRLLTRQIHNACILPTATATRPALLHRSLPAAALLFSSPTAPSVTTATRTRILACGRTSSQLT
jgi:hypothetical protein